MNSGVRVSIPNNVKKTIQNIKEITGNHSEDEIYAMLKECSMDPNETAQKLLSQDPFHEVRRKRDRKKEIVNKESTEPRWKPGMQGRRNRGGRNYSSRHISLEKPDIGISKTGLSAKENEVSGVTADGSAPQDKKNSEAIVVASSSTASPKKLSGPVAEKTSTVPPEANKISASRDVSVSKTQSPKSRVYLSASDPILLPSQDSRLPSGTIRREVGSPLTPVDQVKETTPAEIKTASVPEVVMFQGEGNNLISESSRPLGRPPSNYNNRPQQAIGPQKGGSGKEWKPKSTNPIPVETHSSIKPASSIPDSKDATSEKESQIPGGQHVIIPNHLHVPEAEKLGFHFGSFDATFGVNSISLSGPVSDKSPSLSEASQDIVEHIEEHPTRNQDVLVTADDGDHSDHHLSSSSNVPENLSSNVAPEPIESKQETLLPTAGHQYPAVHPSSNISFGFVPPIIGSQLAPFESNESQVPDVSRVPSFVIQQPFDPSSYYPQFFRSGAESDGRISPFHQPGKYNGNAPPQASQSSQEVGNSVMLSGTGQTSLATQAGGVVPSSIAVTQQPLPVFRQPTGLQVPHYPPNYIPYAPYFSPFYMPPPIHQFLSNGAYPQQPQGGYPLPQVAPQKYPLAQYKPGSNSPNTGHIGVPGTFGPYGLSPAAGYNPNPVATAGNSSSNEDLGVSQFKENNVYASGPQSEGPGVWIAAPGRDIPGSYYDLSQGGQVSYNPTQIPHGTFTSIYHPGQPVTTGPIHPLLQHPQTMSGGVDIVGPTSSPYPHQQQPQPTQINWPNNY